MRKRKLLFLSMALPPIGPNLRCCSPAACGEEEPAHYTPRPRPPRVRNNRGPETTAVPESHGRPETTAGPETTAELRMGGTSSSARQLDHAVNALTARSKKWAQEKPRRNNHARRHQAGPTARCTRSYSSHGRKSSDTEPRRRMEKLIKSEGIKIILSPTRLRTTRRRRRWLNSIRPSSCQHERTDESFSG